MTEAKVLAGGVKVDRRQRFDLLDSLRGVAAAMVLFGHATAVMLGPENTLVPHKALAVFFFFMLSGFVIGSAYDGKVGYKISFLEFLTLRVIRLYPLIILSAVVSSCWILMNAHSIGYRGALSIVAAAVAVPTFRTSFSFGYFPVNPPEWSLFFEMIFYILFGLIKPKSRRLPLIVGGGLISAAFIRFKYGDDFPLVLAGILGSGYFFIGLSLWRLYRAKMLPTVGMPLWVLAMMIFAICLCPFKYDAVVEYIIPLVAFPAIIVMGLKRGREATAFEKLLGELSYPVYILHWPILTICQKYVQPKFGAAAAIAIGMVLAIMFAWIASRLFDQPIRRRLVRKARAGFGARWNRRRSDAVEATSFFLPAKTSSSTM